jgi:hypothetical protein
MRESILRIGACKLFDTGLELHSGSNRSERAWKLCQEPVAGILDDAAAMFGDRGRDIVRKKRCQLGMRGLFVMVHEPQIASHIGSQDRRQPTFSPDWPLLDHGMQPNPQFTLRRIRGECQTRSFA